MDVSIENIEITIRVLIKIEFFNNIIHKFSTVANLA